MNYSTQLNLNGSSTVNREENKRELNCGDFPLLIRFFFFLMEIHIWHFRVALVNFSSLLQGCTKENYVNLTTNKEEVNFALKTRYQWLRNTINLAGRTLPKELLTFISSLKICKICEYHALGPNKHVKNNILNIRINN